jgi:uncharacterized protein
MIFDPMYFLYLSPAILLAAWAQYRVSSAYSQAQKLAAPLSGAAAARHILNSAGLEGVPIEAIPGHLSDHYDPRAKVLRLSQEVYQSRTLAAVGIAAHEAGHALQDSLAYAPLAVRNAIVPMAGFGSNMSFILIMIGAFLSMNSYLIWAGIGLYSAVVAFQIVNLPVEFNASSRAKVQLAGLGIVNEEEMRYVDKVLGAAALTYVAATLTAILTLMYYIMRFTSSRD